MTKLLDKAVDAVRQLPADSQDEIARAMLRLAAVEQESEPVDPAHVSAILEGLAHAGRGEYATDAEIKGAFGRFGR
jgi:hypothetical protein